MQKISIAFNRNDDPEYNRQLELQEDGLNDLTVQEYLANRESFKENGRSPAGDKAQQDARAMAHAEKTEELMDNGLSRDEAEAQSSEWTKTQHALHSPDQIAGGNPEKITGVGDGGVNSSLGSQWGKGRADELEDQVNERVSSQENTFKEQGLEGDELNHAMQDWKDNTNLNVELTQGKGEEVEGLPEQNETHSNEPLSGESARAPPEQDATQGQEANPEQNASQGQEANPVQGSAPPENKTPSNESSPDQGVGQDSGDYYDYGMGY